MKKKAAVVGGSLVIVLALFAGAYFVYQNQRAAQLESQAQENANLVAPAESPYTGDPNAKVTVVEFLDPECESCRMFYPMVKKLLEEYAGKIKLVVRYATFHQNSPYAVAILEATRNQNRYWQALEILFYYQPQWGSHHHPQPEKIWEFLPEIDLDLEKVREDMKDPKIQEIIKRDMAAVKDLGVRGTPTFFVNGKMVDQFGYDYLKEAIQKEVDRLY